MSSNKLNPYAKNAAGQMEQLHTWRDETGNPDITRWYYDLFTGAVTNKLYADGMGIGYTYLSDGRMASRLWARNITTAYSYTDTSTGSTKTIEYNDNDITPSISNTYNLAGQLLKVEDGTGTSTFGYDSKGSQTAETNALAIITRSYDTYGRYIRFTLIPWLSYYPSFCVNYGYDLFNRIDTVTTIIGSQTNIFTYSYIPGTRLISGYIGTTSTNPHSQIQIQKSFEINRNLITSVSNIWNSTVISSSDYNNDSTGKRTARSDYYNGSTVNNTFNFNARGETTNAVMNANTYNYDFDDIGNRTTSSVNSVISTYTANQLNQYTALRTNGIYRAISHDQDGNLRYDGYWTYSWNAENRPIDICHSLYHATNDEIRVQMKYDYRNRRVERKITKFRMTVQSTLTPFVDGVWDAVITHKYIWDEWNIAAEIIIDHVNPMTNITYYTWGLDLSGTLQGAGGVGGLLAATVSTPSTASTYYALADANGNVTEYVDDTGIVKAHYEYNACGEITAQSGILEDDFTHRFSTKPYDPETRLVQYQERPLKPDLSRWLSRDPIGIKGGLNEYGFVDNDAVNWFDSFGDKKSKGKTPTWLAFLKAAKEIYNNYETYKNLTSQAKDTFKSKINPCYDCCWKGKPNYKVSDWDDPDNQNVGWQVLHRQMGCELKRAGASQEAMALLNVLYESKTSIYEMLAKLKLNPKSGIDDWINDTARDMAAVMEGWNNGGGDCTTKFIPSECKKIK